MVTLRPQGDYCAVASYQGTTISIVDLNEFPQGPFPVVASFSAVRAVHDIDWGPNGIVAVGEDGSITWIDESSGPSWSLQYSHYDQTVYERKDFHSLSIVDSQRVVIGGKGKPNAPHQYYPILFLWSYSSGQGSLIREYVTEGIFTQDARVWGIDVSGSCFAACESSGDDPWVAVFDINGGTGVRVKLSDQVDNVYDVAYSQYCGHIVTAGEPGGATWRSNNARLLYSGGVLTDLGEFDSCQFETGRGAAVLEHAGRPLGFVATDTRVAAAYLDDNTEPFGMSGAGCSINHCAAASQERSLVLIGNGDLYHVGAGPVLEIPDLLSGQSVSLTVGNAVPNGQVTVAYSLAGSGPITTVYGLVFLSPPISMLPLAGTDPSGVATIPVTVPTGYTGTVVSFQALDRLGVALSNFVQTAIQ